MVTGLIRPSHYWGSCSHDTAFRNWFHASSNKTTEWWAAANLNRFTRCYNIVGNILGKKGYTWLYEVEMTGFGYGKHGAVAHQAAGPEHGGAPLSRFGRLPGD